MKKPTFVIGILSAVLYSSLLFAQNQKIVLSFIGDHTTLISRNVLVEAYAQLRPKVELDFKVLPAERALASSNKGIMDGEVNRIRGIDKKYPNLVMVPVSINSFRGVAFSANKDLKINGWQSISKLKVGIRGGIKFSENGTRGFKKLTRVPSNEILLLQAQKGWIDVGISSYVSAYGIIKNKKLKGVHLLEPPLVELRLFHYLHKKNKELIPKITAILKKMEEAGRIKEIKEEYLSAL